METGDWKSKTGEKENGGWKKEDWRGRRVSGSIM
jgi:hypothetical protein